MKNLGSVLLLSLYLAAAPAAHAQAAKDVQDRHMADFTAALDAYSACLTASADKSRDDASKSPEAIADSAHTACVAEYGKATDLAIIYTASTVPDRAKLQAVVYATQQMDAYKAQLRGDLVKDVAAKRSGKVDG